MDHEAPTTAKLSTPNTPQGSQPNQEISQNKLETTQKCSVCLDDKQDSQMEWDYERRAYLDVCWVCSKKQREEKRIQTFLNGIDDWLWPNLLRIGMSKREAKADLKLVPMPIKKALPGDVVKILLSGNPPAKGFGLGGNTDAGKTMAVAAIIKSCIVAWAKQRILTKEIPCPSGEDWPKSIIWSSWPDEVQWLRSNAISPDAPERVERLSSVQILILDDLGRERIKGSYSDDWAASQLDSVVNSRYRDEMVTIWTTNVTEEDLVSLYGAALMRRLTADNPLIWIKGDGQ